MAKPEETQQPAPEPKEEGPRSFIVFIRNLAGGDAESILSYELHELGKRLQEEAHARGDKVKGTLTLALGFIADPKGMVEIGWQVTAAPPKPRRPTGMFWFTKGGNLSPEIPRQTKFPFSDVANERGIPNDLNDEDPEPARDV